ncbi:hypothetical protein ES705_30605 [subsurface metagenome]
MRNFIISWIVFALMVMFVLSLPARVPFLKKILYGDEVDRV